MIVAQYAIDALSVGALYALAALGIGLIFGIMRLINFAHGEFIMIGGYFMLMLIGAVWPITLFGGVVIVIILALATERIAFRPLRNSAPIAMLAGSFAVSFFLQNLFRVFFGGRPKGVDLLPGLSQHITFGPLSIPGVNIFSIALSLMLMVGLALFLARTRLGIEMRAAAEDIRMARMLGVPTNLVIAGAFAISGLLAGATAVIVVAKSGGVWPTMGLQLALIAFVSTVIGGMGSLVGAALGGFTIGALTVVIQAVLAVVSVELLPYRDAFIFGIVLVFLLLRPGGLIRVKAIEERV